MRNKKNFCEVFIEIIWQLEKLLHSWTYLLRLYFYVEFENVIVVLRNTTHTKDHCLNCLFNDPILNWSVPFKLKPLFTKSDID